MKVIHCAPQHLGFKGPAEAGEDRVAQLLGRLLDDSHYLVRNFTLPHDPYDLDMILVGPSGIWEFEILQFSRVLKTDRGWLYWDQKAQEPQLVPAVLVPRTMEKVNRLSLFLVENGFNGLEINQANILATTKAPRDFTLPGLQVIFLEELSGFIRSAFTIFKTRRPVPVERVIELLTKQKISAAASSSAAAAATPLTSKQWAVVWALLLAILLALGGLTALVLYTYFG